MTKILGNGHCLCGAVSFSVTANSAWCTHCHCKQCQQQSGAAFVTWLGYPEHACMIDDTQNTLRWFASSSFAQRGFCKRCGSSIFFKSEREIGELHIAAANFTSALDHEPDGHDYWHERAKWLHFEDALPKR
jgi:hypothetical protein